MHGKEKAGCPKRGTPLWLRSTAELRYRRARRRSNANPNGANSHSGKLLEPAGATWQPPSSSMTAGVNVGLGVAVAGVVGVFVGGGGLVNVAVGGATVAVGVAVGSGGVVGVGVGGCAPPTQMFPSRPAKS